MDLINFKLKHYPTIAEYRFFFSNTRDSHQDRPYLLYHEISLNTSEKTKIIQSMFSNHNEIKLETNRKIPGKPSNI